MDGFRSEEEEIGLHRATQRINVLVVDTCEAKPVPVAQRRYPRKAGWSSYNCRYEHST